MSALPLSSAKDRVVNRPYAVPTASTASTASTAPGGAAATEGPAVSLPDISVVMPTYRRPDLLERCLRALIAQTLERGRFEVIVVDDGQEDRCRELVGEIAARPDAPVIRYRRSAAGRGPAVARNTGWHAASAPIVAFTDDDTMPDADWLSRGLRAMQANPQWVAAAGQVRVPPTLELGGAGAPPPPTDHELMTRGLETAEFVTANAFVRRDTLARIGGFDERFLRAWREDSDLQFRLQEQGPVGRIADALVWHPVRPERWGVSLRQQRNVFFDALLYRKHPGLYRSRVRRVPPWDYYGVVALTVAAIALGVAGQGVPALAAIAVAGLLILRIAMKRLRRTARTPSHVWEMLCTSAAIPFLSVYWRLRGAWHFRTPFL